MSVSKPVRKWPAIWNWALVGGFIISVLINLGLAAKIAVFDSNYPFRPICHGGRHIGLVVINDPISERFKDRMRSSLWNARLSRDDILYISYWEWLYEKENIWNVSRASAEHVYERQNGIKRMSQELREKLQTARCKFIRKHALEKTRNQ